MVLTKPNKDKEKYMNYFIYTSHKDRETYASTVAFESCRYIKLEKHKLDHIVERKIRISLYKLVYSFLEVKLQRLRRKGIRGQI